MKKLLYTLGLSLVLSLSALAQFNDNIVIAHRGAWKTDSLPENSIASLKKAVALGCHGTEFDVHMTADSILVVNHDHEFYGMDIEKSTYAQLLEKKYPNGEAIPTLEAYLHEGMKQKKTKLIVEIKTSQISPEHALTVAEKTYELVKKLKAEKWVEYICFSWEVGRHLHELDKKADIAYLEGDRTPAEAKAAGYTGIDYHFSVYKEHPTWIAEAHKLGLSVNAWTVNDRAEMETLISQKAEYITTNEPELLFEVLKEKKQ
jgi:glycerophosphoryl diester phosphodiesterase